MPQGNERRSILPLSGNRSEETAGRRPGPGTLATQQVPAGIEQLLGMAASDAAFANAFFDRRQEAVAASGVVLSPAEQAVLAATPEAALRQMVTGVKQRLPGDERRSFLHLADAEAIHTYKPAD